MSGLRGEPHRGRAGDLSRTNVLIRDGVIERVGDVRSVGPGTREADALLEVDGRGLVALPALVEPHAHLDKALTAGVFTNGDRDLPAAIKAWVGGRDPAGAIAAASPQRTVFRDGRIVSVTTVHTDQYLGRPAMFGR